ncbi:MAG: hypothetical protein ACOC92_02035 [bacterium]
MLHPDFVLVRRSPLPIPPGDPFRVRWTFAPREGFSGAVRIEDGLAPGFQRPQGPTPLEFRARGGQARSRTRSYELVSADVAGTVSVSSRVTVRPRGAGGEAEAFELLLPLGPEPGPDLGDVPSEPTPSASADPDFGPGACGRAAERLWAEHVERLRAVGAKPSPAREQDLEDRADRCRQVSPSYGGVACGSAGASAWAACFLRQGHGVGCSGEAEDAIERCRRLGLEPVFGDILGGFRDELIDLDG